MSTLENRIGSYIIVYLKPNTRYEGFIVEVDRKLATLSIQEALVPGYPAPNILTHPIIDILSWHPVPTKETSGMVDILSTPRQGQLIHTSESTSLDRDSEAEDISAIALVTLKGRV